MKRRRCEICGQLSAEYRRLPQSKLSNLLFLIPYEGKIDLHALLHMETFTVTCLNDVKQSLEWWKSQPITPGSTQLDVRDGISISLSSTIIQKILEQGLVLDWKFIAKYFQKEIDYIKRKETEKNTPTQKNISKVRFVNKRKYVNASDDEPTMNPTMLDVFKTNNSILPYPQGHSTVSSRSEAVVKQAEPVIKEEIEDPSFNTEDTGIHATDLFGEPIEQKPIQEEVVFEQALDDIKEESMNVDEVFHSHPATSHTTAAGHAEAANIVQVVIKEEDIKKEIFDSDETFPQNPSTSCTAVAMHAETSTNLPVANEDCIKEEIFDNDQDFLQQPSTSHTAAVVHADSLNVVQAANFNEECIKEEVFDSDQEFFPVSSEDADNYESDDDDVDPAEKDCSSSSNFQCDVCNRFFSSFSNLKRHSRRVHTAGELPFKCELCDEGFRFMDGLIRHITIHTDYGKKKKTPKEKAKHVCDICGTSLASKTGLEQHRRVHFADIYGCERCGRRFTSKHYWTTHVQSLSCERATKKSDIHQCSLCKEFIINFGPLLQHYRDVHGKDPMKVWKKNYSKTE